MPDHPTRDETDARISGGVAGEQRCKACGAVLARAVPWCRVTGERHPFPADPEQPLTDSATGESARRLLAPADPSEQERVFAAARIIHDYFCDCIVGDPDCSLGPKPLDCAHDILAPDPPQQAGEQVERWTIFRCGGCGVIAGPNDLQPRFGNIVAHDQPTPGCADDPERIEVVPASALAQATQQLREARDSNECVCGDHHSTTNPPGPDCRPRTWQEVAEKSRRAALERRKEGQALAQQLREAEGERDLMERANETSMKLADSLAGQLEAAEQQSAELRERVEELANEAARAVTEPRRFHENEDDRQQKLGQAIAKARSAARAAVYPKGSDDGN